MIENNLVESLSDKITQNIKKTDIYKNSKNIGLYYPIKGEIDLRKLLEDKKKNFYFPKCLKQELVFAKYDNNLIEGAYSIPEPQGDSINPAILDVIFVPALCCNKKYYRLGWGKGFYDRFFLKNKITAKKVIICSKCFIREDFTEDNHDFKCDNIMCEDGLI